MDQPNAVILSEASGPNDLRLPSSAALPLPTAQAQQTQPGEQQAQPSVILSEAKDLRLLSAETLPATPTLSAQLLSDSYIFHWELQSFREDLFFILAVALCLSIGLAAGHPAAGMIAAGGAMTTGFSPKHTIEGSALLPMIFVSLGMSVSTFIGMVAGHGDFTLVVIASLFGFGYGMLTMRDPAFGWVGQQCVITLLVASAFPFSPKDAAIRSALIFSGGLVQLLCSALFLRAFDQLSLHLRNLARHIRDEQAALRDTYLAALHSVRQRRLHGSALPYALRLAAVLAISTELYRRMHFASGYWIPMTALLVLRPGITDTANRAVARTVGTLAGAVLASTFLVYIHPAPPVLAGLVVLFTWLSYSTVNVNYALFSIAITSYIVFLLSLANIPGAEIAHRRAVCTIIGGSIALAVRLVVIFRRDKAQQQPLT